MNLHRPQLAQALPRGRGIRPLGPLPSAASPIAKLSSIWRFRYMEVLPDEEEGTTAACLWRVILWSQAQGVQARKLLPIQGIQGHAEDLRHPTQLHLARPPKDQRRDQAPDPDGPTWQHSDERSQALNAWLHDKHHHRP